MRDIISFIGGFTMTRQTKLLCSVLLLGLTALLPAAPVSAQVEKATVKINGMI